DVAHDGAFGDLEVNAVWRNALLGGDAGDSVDDVGDEELLAREVDADAVDAGGAGIPAPDRELAAGLAQEPLAQGHDDAAFLGDGDEVAGGDHAEGRMAPACEGFDGFDFAGVEGDDRLIVEDELVAFDGEAEFVFEFHAALDVLAHGFVKHHPAAFA